MRRLALVLSLVLIPLQAAAFDRSPKPLRIGVFCPVDGTPGGPASLARTALVDHLRQRGFHVVEVGLDADSFDGSVDADYFIELVSDPFGRDQGWADVQVAGAHSGLSVGIAATEFFAEARIYDGRNLSLVANRDLTRNAAVLPATIGFGGRSVFASFALPWVERAQIRRALRAIGRDAATFLQQTVTGS